MRRYNVPRIAFINKLDRMGANPQRVLDLIKTKLRLNAAAIQVGTDGLKSITLHNRIVFGVLVSDTCDRFLLQFA